MKKLLLASLLALPMLAVDTGKASAFFCISGTKTIRYCISCPRIRFSLDWGCKLPPCGPATGIPLIPWHKIYPGLAPMPPHCPPAVGYAPAANYGQPSHTAPRQAVLPPAGVQRTGYQYYPAQPVPAYWYGR